MSQTLSPAALLVLRRIARHGYPPAVAEPAAEHGVLIYPGLGEGNIRIVCFDASGVARIEVGMSERDYTPELARRIEAFVAKRYPGPARLSVLR